MPILEQLTFAHKDARQPHDDVSEQIAEHHRQEATRSCLDHVVGIVYHPDSDSLTALQKLYKDAMVVEVHSAKNRDEIALQVLRDRQALQQRNQADRIFADLAENAALIIKGRIGIAATLSTFALNHMKPGDSLPNLALGAGAGIAEGGVFRAGMHVAGKAVHHAEVTIVRYMNEALKPPLLAAGKYCGDVIKAWKPWSLVQSVPLELLPTKLFPSELLPLDVLPTIIFRPPASRKEAFNVVSHLLKDVRPAADTGSLCIAEHNAQYGNAEKALLYLPSYKLMLSRAHLIFGEEVDPEFCRTIAESLNYKWCASRVNSRGQGLGFLIHPRLEVVGEPVTMEALAQVDHIPDLRPGFMVRLKDKCSGAQFNAVAVHLKSMRGGNYTHAVRYAQTVELTKYLSTARDGITDPGYPDSPNTLNTPNTSDALYNRPTILGGDWNFFLNRHWGEMAPLRRAGFQLIDPLNEEPTQEFGGRLDGFMTRNTPWTFSSCETFNFWRELPASSFSDHGMLRVQMNVVEN